MWPSGAVTAESAFLSFSLAGPKDGDQEDAVE